MGGGNSTSFCVTWNELPGVLGMRLG